VALDILAFIVTYGAVFVGAWFVGGYMVSVFQGQRTFLSFALRPVERGIYKVTGIDEEHEQSWKGYLVAMLLVSVVGLVFTYVILASRGAFRSTPRASRGCRPRSPSTPR